MVRQRVFMGGHNVLMHAFADGDLAVSGRRYGLLT